MDWQRHLEDGERIVWQGRPAPRCFTFRNWRHSLFGITLLVMSGYWFHVGLQLDLRPDQEFFRWVPIPFLLIGLQMSIGHLLLSRLEWEKVFYLLTDRRLLVRRGLFRRRLEALQVAELGCFKVKQLGEELASVRVRFGGGETSVVLSCLEHPATLVRQLETIVADNGGPGAENAVNADSSV